MVTENVYRKCLEILDFFLDMFEMKLRKTFFEFISRKIIGVYQKVLRGAARICKYHLP